MIHLAACPLTPELLPAALELDQSCFGGLWTEAGYQREIESPNSELLVLVPPPSLPFPVLALGCLWAILEEAHITILAVHPSYQRQGLGQAMLWLLLYYACQRGLERATLEVRDSNRSARDLYQKFGFREAGRRRKYYADTGEDALILWQGGLHREPFQQALGQWQQQIDARLHQEGWQLVWPSIEFSSPCP